MRYYKNNKIILQIISQFKRSSGGEQTDNGQNKKAEERNFL